MINIGEVYCHGCEDAFEPEGLPNFDEPNYCYDCLVQAENEQVYREARYGGAPVF